MHLVKQVSVPSTDVQNHLCPSGSFCITHGSLKLHIHSHHKVNT